MKTNAIMDEIRSTISPEMELQMELSVAIANRIYDILEAKGMSQKDFARLMGKTETEVSRWLSGTHNLTMATICKISAALNAEVVKVAEKENPAPFMAVHPGMMIKPELEERGMSQKDLAKMIGIQASHLSEVLNGKRALTTDLAMKIESALGLPAKVLLAAQTQALKEFREFKNMVAASDRPELTLDEINEEIRLAREERKARLLQSKSEYKQE